MTGPVLHLTKCTMDDLNLEHLLGRGYFPKELPPCFCAEQFAQFVASNDSFREKILNLSGEREALTYGLTLPGPRVRDLAIIHPVSQARLADEILEAKDEIRSRIDTVDLSLSKPSTANQRAVKPELSGAQITQRRLGAQRNARYYLKCDVAACYHAIYTHSIPWALHGKEEGKENRHDNGLAGNRLDGALRSGMHGQTTGIPVGPDTSLVLAELVLSAVDREFRERFGEVDGFRFMDDYFLVFEERSNAEKALNDLTSALRRYELRLNAKKTELGRVPASIETTWVTKLRRTSLRGGADAQRELENYFSLAIELKNTFPNELVFRYALGRLHRDFSGWRNVDWKPLQNFLGMVIRSELGSLPTALQLVKKLRRVEDEFENSPRVLRASSTGQTVDTDLLRNILANHAIWATKAGYEHEVLWCLWGLFHLELEAPDEMTEAVREFDHPFVKLLLLWGREEGLTDSELNFDAAASPEEAFEGQNWLLNYEALTRGWLADDEISVNDHEVFGSLNDANVQFLDFNVPDQDESPERDVDGDRPGEFASY